MKLANYFFYYGYVGTLIIAGVWGAFINPYFDHGLLFHLSVNDINNFSRINMLSQYRFLRAIELGFGLFAVVFVKDIFSDKNSIACIFLSWHQVFVQELHLLLLKILLVF